MDAVAVLGPIGAQLEAEFRRCATLKTALHVRMELHQFAAMAGGIAHDDGALILPEEASQVLRVWAKSRGFTVSTQAAKDGIPAALVVSIEPQEGVPAV